MADTFTPLSGGLVSLTALAVTYAGTNWLRLASIPTVGGTDFPLLSYLATYRLLTDGKALLQEGYSRFKGKAFKVATIDRWMVMLSGDALVDELRRLPHEVASLAEGFNALMNVKYTFGPEVARDQWHTRVVRDNLNKRLDQVFPDVHDEIVTALNEYIGDAKAGWVTLPAMETIHKVVCRASNRIFVGLTKCRDTDYINLNIAFAADVTPSSFMLDFFPPFLKPLVGRYLTTVPERLARAIWHLEPLVTERRRCMAESGGDYRDKPNDLLQWLLDGDRGAQASAREVIHRILALNFAAVHTTSNACGQALFALAMNPQYLDQLREELEIVISKHGWSRVAMTELIKLDSFIKECVRFWSFQAFGVVRLMQKTYTFCDGTTVPAGTIVGVPFEAAHIDKENYERGDEFLPFRFVEESSARKPFTATYNEHLTFGNGKQACPGRLFASNELKLILGYLIMNYDIRAEVEGVRPEDHYLGMVRLPNPTAKVLLKRRAE